MVREWLQQWVIWDGARDLSTLTAISGRGGGLASSNHGLVGHSKCAFCELYGHLFLLIELG